EAHLDLLEPLPFARVAPAAGNVEREAARVVAAQRRFGGLREEPAHVVPDADVGRGTRPRRLADRRLIDLEHAIDPLGAVDRVAADEGRLPLAAASAACREHTLQVVAEHVPDERALAA